MKFSQLQFQDPALLDLQFSVNDGFRRDKKVKMKIDTAVRVEQDDEEKNEATVTVSIGVGEKNAEAPFYISVTEQALFHWECEEQLSSEFIKQLLKNNAVALLIGYIRPIIAMVTNSSPYNSFNLPFIDLREEQGS